MRSTASYLGRFLLKGKLLRSADPAPDKPESELAVFIRPPPVDMSIASNRQDMVKSHGHLIDCHQ
jgi:hypothetical protein